MDKISIMGVRINNVSMDEMLSKIKNKLKNKEKYVIFTPNTEFVMMCQKDQEFMNYMNASDTNVPDGIGLIYASKIKRYPLKEKVGGFDLSVKMLELADRESLSLYIVGGKPGVSESAIKNINQKYPNIIIGGQHHGYFKGTHLGHKDHEEEITVIESINHAEPDILFVGFGAKKQEQWIHYNKEKLNAKIIIGNGGSIDIFAGNSKRAPKIFINMGLEWLYRLLQEPSRISRQIVLPIFIFKVIFGGKNIVKEIK